MIVSSKAENEPMAGVAQLAWPMGLSRAGRMGQASRMARESMLADVLKPWLRCT
jgi:hypothetical protein